MGGNQEMSVHVAFRWFCKKVFFSKILNIYPNTVGTNGTCSTRYKYSVLRSRFQELVPDSSSANTCTSTSRRTCVVEVHYKHSKLIERVQVARYGVQVPGTLQGMATTDSQYCTIFITSVKHT